MQSHRYNQDKVKSCLTKLIPYLLVVMIAVVILWPQIHNQAFVSGLDYYFHMSRTYETAMQIKTGHFSYFLSLFSWDHSARIVNALYGPIGGYISGLILLLVKSWYRWELCISFLALFLSGSTMYYLSRYWHVNRYVNFLISILYMLSSPISDLVFSQTFAGFSAALLPLIVLLASEILFEKDVNPVKLALILVMIIEIHLMSFILSMLFLIPCILLGFFVTKSSRTLLVKHVFEAASLTILLSFNVWGSILEVLGSNLHHIIPTFPESHIGQQNFNTIMNTYPQTTLLQTPSVIGMAVTVLILVTFILWLFKIKHVSYIVDIFMLFGMAFVWASSEWFPWQLIERHLTFIASTIQFPKRFLPMGLALLYLSMGVMLSKFIRLNRWPKLTLNFALIFLVVITGSCWQNNQNSFSYKINKIYNQRSVIDWVNMKWRVKPNPTALHNALRSDHPDQFFRLISKPVPDYLPTSEIYRHSSQYSALNPYNRVAATFYHHIPYRWHILNSDNEIITIRFHGDHVETVPFVKYSHTRILFNQHRIDPRINKVGAMRLPLKNGNNRLSISYQPSRWFKLGILISIVSWLSLLFEIMIKKLSKRSNE